MSHVGVVSGVRAAATQGKILVSMRRRNDWPPSTCPAYTHTSQFEEGSLRWYRQPYSTQHSKSNNQQVWRGKNLVRLVCNTADSVTRDYTFQSWDLEVGSRKLQVWHRQERDILTNCKGSVDMSRTVTVSTDQHYKWGTK
jgi:hypothetical protein